LEIISIFLFSGINENKSGKQKIKMKMIKKIAGNENVNDFPVY